VRRFDAHADRFEFTATRGVVPRNATLGCGVTEHFFIARAAGNVWTLAGSREEIVC
jgi:hypothetical protein